MNRYIITFLISFGDFKVLDIVVVVPQVFKSCVFGCKTGFRLIFLVGKFSTIVLLVHYQMQ